MSIDAVVARMNEIYAMTAAAPVRPAATPPPATTTTTAQPGATTFADTLAQATAATAPTAAPAPAAIGTSVGGDPSQFDAAISESAQRNGVDPNLVKAVIKQESGFDPNAQSPAGAQGLMQLMPSTAAGLGVSNPLDPTQAIEGGTKYLKSMLDRFGGDVSLALAAYNAGPNAVARYGGVPPYAETQKYVQSVLANLQAFSSTTPPTTGRSLS
jgi:soluble lytic murein transglycosylase-like protein